jgi:uncharacterized protein
MSHDSSEEGWSPQGPVVELSDQASWDLLASKNFGHLALSHHDLPDIFPVNYHSDGTRILFRTASGSKLHELTENQNVAFEVDAETPTSTWSVVAHGPATVLDDEPILSNEAQESFPRWIPVQPYVFVSIVPHTIRGRVFEHHLPVGHI